MLQKEKITTNMGSGNYLHKGSWEPSVVVKNPLGNSDVPSYQFPLGQEEREE